MKGSMLAEKEHTWEDTLAEVQALADHDAARADASAAQTCDYCGVVKGSARHWAWWHISYYQETMDYKGLPVASSQDKVERQFCSQECMLAGLAARKGQCDG